VSAAAGEIPVTFQCGGATLLGVLHRPAGAPRTGVVIVVGGPQYRVGSHRQFVLLGRRLAASGIAALRFDCRGMGDSEGDFPGFEATAPDIAAALAALRRLVPSIDRPVLWGLCDGAAAITLSANAGPKVAGLVLLNPWVRTEASHAQARLKHYYLQRLVDPDLFRKIARGEFRPFEALGSLLAHLRRAFGRSGEEGDPRAALPERMALGLAGHAGPLLLILSGRDLTAREFADVTRQSARWRRILDSSRLTRHELPEADHTFSRREWSERVEDWTLRWIAEQIGV